MTKHLNHCSVPLDLRRKERDSEPNEVLGSTGATDGWSSLRMKVLSGGGANWNGMSGVDSLLALDGAARVGELAGGDLVLLLAAGTGYTWAATAIRWGLV